MQIRLASGALALLVGLSLSACDDDEPAAGSSAAPSAEPSASTLLAVASPDPTKLGCDGYAAAGVFDYAAPAPGDRTSFPRNRATPESLASGFKDGRTARSIKGWDLDNPPTATVIRTRDKRGKSANAYYARADGAVIAILNMEWSRATGWRVGGDQFCTYGPDEPRPEPTPLPAPEVVIDLDAFSPRIRRDVLDLDCPGGVTTMKTDRAPNPAAKPLPNLDAETGGLAEFTRRLVRQHPGYRSFDGSKPPARVMLFPRLPADAMRAVVRLVSPSGQTRVLYLVGRDVDRGPWHIESRSSCN